jgi:hypothetical protein
MSLIRINDLARELEVKSKAILDALAEAGVTEKKTHSSSLKEYEAEKVREVLRAAAAESTRGLRHREPPTIKIDLSKFGKPGDGLRAITEEREKATSPVLQRSGQTQPPPQTPAPRLILPEAGSRPVYKAPTISSRVSAGSSPSPPGPAVPIIPPSRPGVHGPPSTGRPNSGNELVFMRDEKLRQIAVRDYAELRKVAGVGAVKSRFILMGAILEAMLLDALLPCNREAGTTRAAAKEKDKKLDQWRLASLIDAAVELDFVKPGVKNFSHQVRDFRNLIHPAFEKRMKYDVRKEEADILEQVLKLVMQDLYDIFGQQKTP